MAEDETADRDSPRGNLLEIAGVFTKLGFTAFGGPAAHLAMMESELVTRRRWCDRQHFLDAASAVNFVPGPNSTELAIYMGFLRGGFPGLIIAGACFVAPAVLIILPIAFLYVRYGTYPSVAPILHALAAVIVAIIAVACLRLANSAMNGARPIVIAIATLTILLLHAAGWTPLVRLFGIVQPEIAILAAAAVVGLAGSSRARWTPAVSVLFPYGDAATTQPTRIPDDGLIEMVWFFLKVGATLFGSGYVLASFLQTGLVEQNQWISNRELADAIAIGQFTPGPLLTTATFIGYVLGYRQFGGGDAGGALGAILATLAIFAPSFLFVGLLARVLQRLRRSPLARAALDAMNAAVVVLISFTIVKLADDAFTNVSGGWDLVSLGTCVAGTLLLLRFNFNATWLVLGGLSLGAVRMIGGF